MSDRRVFLVFVVLALALLALTAGQVHRGDGASALTHGLRVASSPLVESVAWISVEVRQALRGYADLRGARAERDLLLERVRQLEAERQLYAEAFRENERLRRMLDLSAARGIGPGVGARVVADLSAGPLRRAVLVDRGTDAGVWAGWVALDGGALVGRVRDATARSSEVLLIADPDSGVAVRHQEGRFSGILRGANRGSPRLARLDFIPRDQSVAVGDAIVTSGLDGVFPPGILVGHVRGLSGEAPLTWEITVEVASDTSVLEEVLLVPPVRPQGPPPEAP
jgi:rod shape-determining protein MreC